MPYTAVNSVDYSCVISSLVLLSCVWVSRVLLVLLSIIRTYDSFPSFESVFLVIAQDTDFLSLCLKNVVL